MDGEHCYFLSLEVEPLAIGESFTATPLHCTLMPRFFSTLSAPMLAEALQPIFTSAKAIALVPVEQVAFGPNRLLATTLQLTPQLKELHETIYKLLNNLNTRYTETDWIHDGFNPHVSDRPQVALPLDTTVLSQAVYLIEVEYPLSGQHRFVRHKFSLYA